MAENRKRDTNSAENRKREVLKPGKLKNKATESRKTIKFSAESRKRTPYNPPSLMHEIILRECRDEWKNIVNYLGSSHYILLMTDPDRGFSSMSKGKKIRIKILGQLMLEDRKMKRK